MNFKLKGERILEDWMLEGAQIENFEPFTDLHIDQITSISKYRSDWIEKSFISFHKGIAVKERLFKDDCVLTLCIPLRMFKKKRVLHFKHVNELTKYLCSTPPSFNIYTRESNHYKNCVENGERGTIKYKGNNLILYKSNYYCEEDKAFIHHLTILEDGL